MKWYQTTKMLKLFKRKQKQDKCIEGATKLQTKIVFAPATKIGESSGKQSNPGHFFKVSR